MKRSLIIIFSILSYSLFSKAQQKEPFYYYSGEKIYLQIDSSRISIVSQQKMDLDNVHRIVAVNLALEYSEKSYTKQNVVLLKDSEQQTDEFITEINLLNKIEQAAYFSTIQKLQKEEGIVHVAPSYIIQGKRMGLSNNLYVKLHAINDVNALHNLADKYSIHVLGYNEFMPLWYTVSCTKKTPLNALQAANLFYETGLFEYAEPEFLLHDLLQTNDQYYNNQWNLKNTGQHGGTLGMDIKAESAWTKIIGTGSSNIRVAVFDSGFEMNHPDLQSGIYGTGYDVQTSSSPSIVREKHGTACAGIIGARQNNTIGISGVAPYSKLMSISITLPTSDNQKLANGINWAWQNGADVISNSWSSGSSSNILNDAIINAITQGRDSLGCVIVYATGNENNSSVNYPANSSITDIIAVGAMSPCGERKSPNSCDGESWGSNYGEKLDVVAPGVFIPTTDLQGSSGYNTSSGTNGNYYQNFNGTSAACPHVAGVAALMLSINPSLTQQQIGKIINSTCTKLSTYTFSHDPNHPDGTWNNQVGYGLVNAYAALNAIPSISGPQNVYSVQQVSYSISGLPTSTTVTWSGSSNVNFISGQTGSSVTISICGEYSALLTATLSGAFPLTITKTIYVNNGELKTIWGSSYAEVTLTHPYAQCFDWDLDPSLNSQYGSGLINCKPYGTLTVFLVGSAETGLLKVRARGSNGCVGDWVETDVGYMSIAFTDCFLNPTGGDPFWANIIVTGGREYESYQYDWYFDDTLIETTDEPYIFSHTWPAGEHQLGVIARGNGYESELTSAGFWGMR